MLERTMGLSLACGTLALCGCSDTKYQQGAQTLARTSEINCATAEGDIRLLQHEKAHVEDQIAAGVQSIAPASAVLGLVTGKEGENLEVTTGEYNEKIDERIDEIKAKCGLN